MKKVLWLMLVCSLLGSSVQASAQDIFVSAASPHGAYIGIRYDQLDLRTSGGRSNPVVIREVSKGSPAEKAGLRAGDEILRINGLSAGNGKFAAVARTLTEGDTVKLRIKRDGKERDYTVVAAARPAGYANMIGERRWVFNGDSVRTLMKMYFDSARVHIDSARMMFDSMRLPHFEVRINRDGGLMSFDTAFFRRDSAVWKQLREMHPRFEFEQFGPGPIIRSIEIGSRAIAGAEFTDLDPAMKTYFGTDRGLLTLRVVAETPAARAGLQAGDVIVKANDRAVSTIAELRRILLDHPESLKLEVLRKGETRRLDVPLQRKRSQD